MKIKKIKKIKKYLVNLAGLEVQKTLKLALRFVHWQIKIRPRLRLIAKILPILIMVFVLTSEAVAYLKPKEAKIKINGQTILVAQKTENNSNNPGEIEITQKITQRLSPFVFKKPVDGYLSQGYRSFHRANDFATSLGTPIHPLGSGFVEFAGSITNGKGNVIIIDHGDGLKSLYAHLGQINVGIGNLVNPSTVIGTVGLTGNTTGAHVHLEILDREIAINPSSVLPQ